MMLRKPGWRYRLLALLLGFSLPGLSMPVAAELPKNHSRLQQLLSGEAIYQSQLNDYFSAITLLQLAHEEGLLTTTSADSEVLLTRLKLDYGLRAEADRDFRVLLDERIDPKLRNRAWYELARSFYQQRNLESAKAVLDNIRGTVPEDIRGDHQLLQAHVLMGLGLHREAAQTLESWNGARSLRGYAYYNRGIALMLAGQDEDALVPLKRVADLAADTEELLALRDKACVTLGHTLSRLGDLPQARQYLQRVRLHGPSANQALLASGWIAQQQGQTKEALAPWMELRNRALSDPAVQQSMLAVPSLYQQQTPAAAVRDYEAAITAFSRELDSINRASASLRQGESLGDLLAAESKANAKAAAPQPSERMGPLLASRILQQTARGRSDLRSMIDNLDQGLNSLDALARLTGPNSGLIIDQEITVVPGVKPLPGSVPNSDYASRSKNQGVNQAGGIHPSGRNHFLGLPTGYPGDFPDSEVISLPESDPEGLPDSYAFNLPGGGTIFIPNRGDWRNLPRGVRRTASRTSPPPVNVVAPEIRSQPQQSSVPLDELVMALSETRKRIRRIVTRAKLGSRPGGALDEHIASLRQRIESLRDRTVVAIEHYEQYARNLALDELQRSHDQLQHNLKLARLELAKSYDSANTP